MPHAAFPVSNGMKPLLVFNWKMNPQAEAEALALFAKTADVARTARHVSVVVAPPFPFISAIARRWNIKPGKHENEVVHLAAQDLFWERDGAYTGEISPSMEKEAGVTYVIVGHSERRRHLGETNDMVRRKLARALEYGLIPVLCIGEATREGDDVPEEVSIQLRASIADIPALFLESLLVAYEPVWAISGTGSRGADSPEDMHKVAIYIRKILSETYGEGCGARAKILYGGSVNAANVASFFLETGGEVAGVLVGSASLTAEGQKIIEAVDRLAA
jgi:triosephosphate isomerase